MDKNASKGYQFLEEAKSKLKPRGFISNLLSGGSRNSEEAIGLYEKAANCFKMDKLWKEAGDAFVVAAELHLQSDVKHEAASKYVEAANCYRKVDPTKAIQNLFKATEIYTESGRFTIAAKHHITAGEIYEADLNDIDKSSEQYQKAADYYFGEQSTSQGSKCLIKVAEFAMQLEQYDKAIQIYDQIGKNAMENKLLQYGAKDHLFKAVLCMLCLDLINGQKGIKKYEESYPLFTDSREYKLLKQMITCIENNDSDGYSVAVKEHDTISRFEPRIITTLLKIKNIHLHVEEQVLEDNDGIN